MLKILYVINNLSKGSGMAQFIMNVFRRIDKCAFHIDFLLTSKENDFEKEIENAGSIVFMQDCNLNPIKVIGYYKKSFKRLSKEYDIVHVHAMSAKQALATRAAKKAGIKNILFHSHGGNKKGVIYSILQSILNKTVTAKLACSQVAANDVYGKKFADNVTIINNGVDTDKFKFDEEKRRAIRYELGLSDTETAYVNVARMEAQKNQMFLLRAFDKAYIDNKNIKLFLIGDGSLRQEIENYIENSVAKNNIILLGLRNDVPSVLNAMDYFVLPSLFEGLSIAGVEAQANGLPCLFSDAVSAETNIIDRCAFIPLEVDLWAEYLASPKTFPDTRALSYQTVAHKGFDIANTVKSLQNIYLNCAAEN